MFAQLLASAVFVAGVSAHGRVTSPTPRPLGTAMEEACGQQVYNQMASDPNGNIQAMAQTAASQSDYDATACHLWQCRGYQFGDATTDSIQSYSAGETIDFTVDISAPHTGVANVSVIDLSANTVLDQLAYWSVYASVATGVTANETSFSVTMPSDLPSTCSTSGGCALQWWWNAESINQTYMSCIDFVIGDSTTSSSGSSTGSSSSAAAAASTATSAATSASSASSASQTQAAQSSTSSVATTLSTVVRSSSSSAAAAAATSQTSAAAGASSASCTTDVYVTVTAQAAAVASSSTSCTTDTTMTVTVTSSKASSAQVTAAAATMSGLDEACSVEVNTATATVFS